MTDIELEQVIGRIDRGAAFIARPLAGESFLYVVTQKSDHWTYERSELGVGPLVLKGYAGRAVNGEEAYAWVDNDWPQHRNYLRWAQYMANNPPPH